jgi:hypothetical protein
VLATGNLANQRGRDVGIVGMYVSIEHAGILTAAPLARWTLPGNCENFIGIAGTGTA